MWEGSGDSVEYVVASKEWMLKVVGETLQIGETKPGI